MGQYIYAQNRKAILLSDISNWESSIKFLHILSWRWNWSPDVHFKDGSFIFIEIKRRLLCLFMTREEPAFSHFTLSSSFSHHHHEHWQWHVTSFIEHWHPPDLYVYYCSCHVYSIEQMLRRQPNQILLLLNFHHLLMATRKPGPLWKQWLWNKPWSAKLNQHRRKCAEKEIIFAFCHGWVISISGLHIINLLLIDILRSNYRSRRGRWRRSKDNIKDIAGLPSCSVESLLQVIQLVSQGLESFQRGFCSWAGLASCVHCRRCCLGIDNLQKEKRFVCWLFEIKRKYFVIVVVEIGDLDIVARLRSSFSPTQLLLFLLWRVVVFLVEDHLSRLMLNLWSFADFHLEPDPIKKLNGTYHGESSEETHVASNLKIKDCISPE